MKNSKWKKTAIVFMTTSALLAVALAKAGYEWYDWKRLTLQAKVIIEGYEVAYYNGRFEAIIENEEF